MSEPWPWLDPYVADVNPPGMVHAAFARAPHAHATLREVDLAAALASPGVLAAVDGTSFQPPLGVVASSRDEPVLASERIRYAGEPVAAVAALTYAQAVEAASKVRIVVEEAPVVSTWEQALSSPALHAHAPGNVLRDIRLEFGAVDEAFSRADLCLKGTYRYAASTHAALEPHGVVAWWRPERRLWVWTSTQCPHLVQHELARLLGLDPSQVRVMVPRVGGGFGGKSEVYSHEVVASKLSMMLGRPVRLVLSRPEVFLLHHGRHQAHVELSLALGAQGQILGVDADIVLNGGAYAGMGLVTSLYAGQMLALPYQVGALRYRVRRVYTCAPPAGPKRGHGAVHIRFAMERLMDRAACTLGLDPWAWRAQVALAPGQTTVNGLRVGSTGFQEALRAAARWAGTQEVGPGEGLGVAGSAYVCGAAFPLIPGPLPHSQAVLRADRSGLFCLTVGVADVGQGAIQTMRELAAEVLGQEVSSVAVMGGDTDACPVDMGTYSSRVTLMAGQAVVEAAANVRRLILEAASAKLGAEASHLDMEPGWVVDRRDPSRRIPLAKAIAEAECRWGVVVGTGGYTPQVPKGRYPGGRIGPSPTFSFSVAVAKVRVDRDLGTVRVTDVAVAHDCGRPVHPGRVRAQIHGCVAMGLGEALTEEVGLRRGVQDPAGLVDYGVPTCVDLPRVHVQLVGPPDPAGPTGAKEVGEGPLLAVVPAIANAVAQATGTDPCQVPLTPEVVIGGLGHGS